MKDAIRAVFGTGDGVFSPVYPQYTLIRHLPAASWEKSGAVQDNRIVFDISFEDFRREFLEVAVQMVKRFGHAFLLMKVLLYSFLIFLGEQEYKWDAEETDNAAPQEGIEAAKFVIHEPGDHACNSIYPKHAG